MGFNSGFKGLNSPSYVCFRTDWKLAGGEDLEDSQTADRRQLLEIWEQLPMLVDWGPEIAEWQPGEDSWRWEKTKICTNCVRTVSQISWLVEFGQPPYSPDLAPTDFSPFRETKPSLKKISVRQGHRKEHNRWIKCSTFVSLRLLFCWTSRKV